MYGASLVLQQQEHEACLRRKGHSFQQDRGWQKTDLIISIVCLLGCGEKGQEPLSTLYLQQGASSCGIPLRVWKDSTWDAFPYLPTPSQRVCGKLPPAWSHPLPDKRFRNPVFLYRSPFLLRKPGKNELHFWTKNLSCWNRVLWTTESRAFKETSVLWNELPSAPVG